jgi:hypothetical protein
LRAENIARIINSNIPSYKTRDHAFVADGKATQQIRYVERLAASIVDYIDADSESTLMADGEPDGEPAGKELAPVITSIAERYNWISESGSGTSWTNLITHTVFVQFWNPYQTNISGTAAFELYTPSVRYRSIEMPGVVQEPMATVGGSNATVAVSMQANEYKVINMGTATNTLITDRQCSLTNANYPRISATVSTNPIMPLPTRFRAYWNGTIFDYTPNDSQFFDERGPGLKKEEVGGTNTTRIELHGTSRFSINYPQYGFFDPVKGYRSVSDPRQNYLANYDWETLSQTNNAVRWNGRNANTSGPTRQDYTTVWEHRDFVRADQPVGGFVGNSDPTNAPAWSATNATNFIAFMRNAPMQGLGELGNIYDPVQLNDSGFATKGGSPESWYASGGGRTLRVGIPEFDYPSSGSASAAEKKSPAWNTNGGLRATGLLDLFTVAPTNSLGIGSRLGKININTADRDVLAALFYHLGQNADPAFTNSRITADSAFVLADHVISNRPYFRLSDVWKINTALLVATNFSPALGGNSATNIAAIMDPGREQVLSSVLDLIDVQSRCFRVIAIGQTLDSSGRVTAEAALSSVVEVATESDGGSGYKVKIHEISRQTH